MSTRVVTRVSLAQMQKLAERAKNPNATTPPSTVQRQNTFYTVTEHIDLGHGGLIYGIIFGPSKSLGESLHALAHARPRTIPWLNDLRGMDWVPENHITWTENNGDLVLIRIEQETNPEVFEADDEQDLYLNLHRVTDYRFEPVTENARISGTFLTQAAATVAGLTLFREEIKGRTVNQVEEVKEDGLLRCKAERRLSLDGRDNQARLDAS